MNDYPPDDLLFLPLGGAGEIGMNLNLYGHRGKWLMVDLGVMFPEPASLPGVELITPDPAFIEEHRDDLVGLVITHGHEDHLGAVPYLWRRLRCPVYATPFAAALLRRKLAEAELEAELEITVVPLGGTLSLPPFELDFVTLTHSIPEQSALAIRTAAGTVFHTGDWKIDPEPLIGAPIDEGAVRRIGDEGVLAMVCDSTNVFVEGEAGSEATVRRNLIELARERTGRVAITCFASNVARMETAAVVARETDRELVLVGRSLWRMLEVAREAGYLRDIGRVLSEAEAGYLPADKALYVCTGCQGEMRGAMARIAANEHPHVVLGPGDTVVFSSRTIPGNEVSVGRLHNLLAGSGVEVVTDEDAFVHVSGHPCRDELTRMYQWIRPRIAVPVHGEMRHMRAHADLARGLQVPHGIVPANGQLIRLAPEGPEYLEDVGAGRLAVDGDSLVPVDGETIRTRRRLMYNGGAVVTVVADPAGRLLAEPRVLLQGLPVDGLADEAMDEAAAAVRHEVELLPLSAGGDDGRVAEAARRGARRALKPYMAGKRPLVVPQVIRIDEEWSSA